MTAQIAPVLQTVEFDAEGFMADPNVWTPEIGEAIAQALGLKLTERHWLVINFARQEFAASGQPPTLRKITKSTPVDTKEIYQLFPGGPAKTAARIAGLGKPTGCI